MPACTRPGGIEIRSKGPQPGLRFRKPRGSPSPRQLPNRPGACPGAAAKVTALIIFDPVLPVIPGRFNLTCGIAAIAYSHLLTAHAQHAFANPRTWGWITLISRMLRLLAAAVW